MRLSFWRPEVYWETVSDADAHGAIDAVWRIESARLIAGLARIVRDVTGHEPRELRFLDTADGLVAHLTLGLEGDSRLADAHARASEIEERIRRVRPEISDVVVHTEP